MAKALNPKPGESLTRGFTFERGSIDVENRRVTMAISSELPYRRWFGMEILGHEPNEVDLGRLKDGSHPLLWNHDGDTVLGVIESAKLDSDKVVRVTARFSKNAQAEEKWKDVQDGILSLASVRYDVDEWKIDKKKNGEEEWRAVRWTPVEASLVSVPADPSVGIGRNHQPNKNMDTDPKPEPEPAKKPSGHTPEDLARSEQAGMDKERKRVQSILNLGSKFNVHSRASEAAEKGTDYESFRESVFSDLQAGKLNPDAKSAIGKPSETALETPKSFGRALIESESYKSASKEKAKFRTMNLEMPYLSQRATLLSTGLTSIQKLPGIVELEQQPLTIEAIIPGAETESTTIRYIQESAYTNAATAVAEEGSKPEATFSLAEVDATVKKVAVIGRVSEESFADYSQMESYVNNRLAYMVQSKVDSELLNGDGTSNRITGILNFSGIQTVAAGSVGTNKEDAIYHAITKIRAIGFFEPDYVVIHPNDWRDLRLDKDGNQQYYGGGPFNGAYGQPMLMADMLWQKRVVITTAITEGTALVGAFRLGAQIHNRLGLRVDSTNSDASDFQFNRICIRAERRLALAVYRPLAFCTVTGM